MSFGLNIYVSSIVRSEGVRVNDRNRRGRDLASTLPHLHTSRRYTYTRRAAPRQIAANNWPLLLSTIRKKKNLRHLCFNQHDIILIQYFLNWYLNKSNCNMLSYYIFGHYVFCNNRSEIAFLNNIESKWKVLCLDFC